LEETRPRRRKKEILFFVLPNLFTTANLFFGFFSVLSASMGRWETAAFAIFIASFCDGLDGRVARMTKSQSAFGEQYDSMADLVSFGMAPTTLMYMYALAPFGRWGWFASFIYLACAALRLARFNVLKQTAEKRFFQGLASPLAAGTVASAVLFYQELGLHGYRQSFMLGTIIVLGLAMISTVRYRSFKDLKFKSQKTFAYILLGTLAIIIISPTPELTFFPVAAAYVIWAPIGEALRWTWRRFFRRLPPPRRGGAAL
jgi:CDP-diacylglycerol--serine O-phosphatidyltransferase